MVNGMKPLFMLPEYVCELGAPFYDGYLPFYSAGFSWCGLRGRYLPRPVLYGCCIVLLCLTKFSTSTINHRMKSSAGLMIPNYIFLLCVGQVRLVPGTCVILDGKEPSPAQS